MNLVEWVRGNLIQESETMLPSSLVSIFLAVFHVFFYLVLILHSLTETLDNFGLCAKVNEVNIYCWERSEIFVVIECIR